MSYDFGTMLDYSRGVREATDLDTLRALFVACSDVAKTDTELDKRGIDYVVMLRGGAKVNVDAKTRTPGCSKWWRDGPEVALEKWSVMPGGDYNTPDNRAKVGWTLSESSFADYILYTYHPEDCDQVFLFAFQLLRLAFRRHCSEWFGHYKKDVQDSNRWQSEAVFVPVGVVRDAVDRVSQARLVCAV